MEPLNIQLAYEYFERVLGRPLEQIQPVPVTGWEVVEIVWPLNEVFRPFLSRIRTVKYDNRFEATADKAIEAFVNAQRLETWKELPGDTWRILLERHQQLIVVALANEAQRNSVRT